MCSMALLRLYRLDARYASPDHARIVGGPVSLVLRRVGIVFGQTVGVPGHSVKRQWLDQIRTRRIDVHLLAEAVSHQQVRSCPSRWKGTRGRVEAQRNLVAGFRDHEHVVGSSEQITDVP